MVKTTTHDTEPSTDGRRTRGLNNRKQIVQALIDLTCEGVMSPTAEQVSERAGVALRTVFRHFDDMETLYREISAAMDQKVLETLKKPVQGDTVEARLLHAIDRRSHMFEQLMPMQLSSLVHLHESAYLREQQARNVEMQRFLLKLFLPEQMVNDKTLFEALDLCLSIETWIRLRRDQGLSVRSAKQVMRRCALQLIKS